MSVRATTIRRLLLAGVLHVGLCVAPAPAADDADSKPFDEPGINYLERRDPYIQWVAGALLTAACLFIAFKNPHRTHMD